MPEEKRHRLRKLASKVRNSQNGKNILLFLVFVCIATIFWLIMTLNEEEQRTYQIEIAIVNVPDSVHFVKIPPSSVHITVRDKGTSLMMRSVLRQKSLSLNFEDFASEDVFEVKGSAIVEMLQHNFGQTATITAITPEVIYGTYTSRPGKLVPLELSYDVTAASGLVVSGRPHLSEENVMIYTTEERDTIQRVFTDKVILKDIDKPTTVTVSVAMPPNVRVIPDKVKVTFNVESLVKKESEFPVVADKVPSGRDILFFPSKVKVSYLIPMSRYDADEPTVKAVAAFDEAVATTSTKVGIKLTGIPPYMTNVELHTDSVEYTLVKSY